MRVGLVTYALDRARTGIGRYTLELARALGKLAGELDITLLHAGGLGPLDGAGWRARPLPGCSLAPALATLGNAVLPLVAGRARVELIHDPTGLSPFALRSGPRRVVTVHDVVPWSHPGSSTRLDTLLYRHWLPRVLPTVDAVVTDSEHSRQDIARFLGLAPAKIHVVPLAAGDAFQPPPAARVDAVLARHGLERGYLLFLGALDRRRNLPRLLEAYAALRRTTGRVPPLLLVGPRLVSERAVGAKIETLGLEDHVWLLGHLPDDELPALYAGAGLFVFPSLYEGFGLPPLEAMACGAPVLCSWAASLPEVVGEAALLVDPTSTEALCDGMRRILADPALADDLRARGLARATHFSWSRTARETLAVYRDVLP